MLKNNHVVIRSNSAYTTLNVYAPNDEVAHYDACGTVNVLSAKTSSYHEYGDVAFMEVNGGHVEVEEGASVEFMYANPAKVTISDNGAISKSTTETPVNAVSVTNNGDVDHAHTTIAAQVEVNEKAENIIFDYDNNTDQNSDDVYHHVATAENQTEENKNTGVWTDSAETNVENVANKIITEAKNQEATSVDKKANGIVVNVTTGKYYNDAEDGTSALVLALNEVENGQYVSVLQNITVTLNDTGSDSSSCDSTLWFLGDNITLDLNGHKLTTKSNYGGSYNILNLFDGDWTIKDGEIVVLRKNGGKDVSPADENYDVNYSHWDSYAIATARCYSTDPGTLTMENMTMHGGVAAYGGTSVNFSNTNCSMGTNYYAVYTESTGTTVNIDGGTCVSLDDSYPLFYANNGTQINIISGSFSGNIFGKSENGKIVVTGGSFSSDPSDYVSLPYKATYNEATKMWDVSAVTCYKVTYEDGGKVNFATQSEAVEYSNLNASKCYIDGGLCAFYTTQKQIAENKLASGTYICITDTTTYYRNGQATTAQAMFEELTTSSGWGNYGVSNSYCFKMDKKTITQYFATEAEANAFAANYSDAVVTKVN